MGSSLPLLSSPILLSPWHIMNINMSWNSQHLTMYVDSHCCLFVFPEYLQASPRVSIFAPTISWVWCWSKCAGHSQCSSLFVLVAKSQKEQGRLTSSYTANQPAIIHTCKGTLKPHIFRSITLHIAGNLQEVRYRNSTCLGASNHVTCDA